MSDFRRAGPQNDDTDTSFMIAVPPRDEVSANQFNFGGEKMEDPLFDAVEDPPKPAANNDEQDALSDVEEDEQAEEEIEAEKDLDLEELEEELDAEVEDRTQNANDTLMTEDHDETAGDPDTLLAIQKKNPKKKKINVSKYGIPVPSLPAGVVKKLATNFARTSGNSKAKLNKEALAAIMQASDWFFEQVAGDLAAYAEHAGRKGIDESDVITLMKR